MSRSRKRSFLPPPLLWLLLALLGLTASAARAVTGLPWTETELAERADTIVRGRCVSTETTRVQGVLMTVAVIQVDEALKGRVGKTIRVLTPGGVDRDRPVPIRQIFVGAPTIEERETVELYLTPASGATAEPVTGLGPDSYFLTDWSRGKRTLRPGASSEEIYP